jgi:hypothetical protein
MEKKCPLANTAHFFQDFPAFCRVVRILSEKASGKDMAGQPREVK